jgi:membrane-bound metal-dependent hydrolase YbcI (DUF457 family)
MPFTPFHLGPALVLGLPLRKWLHVPTFIVANVILDVEPFLVLLYGFNYPLHGYLHTFLLSFVAGVLLGYAAFILERFVQPIYKVLLLESSSSLNLKSFLLSGALGAGLHVLLDSPLYADIQPFYPLTTNPLHNPAVSTEVYNLCVGMGIFGIIWYSSLLIFSAHKKLSTQSR